MRLVKTGGTGQVVDLILIIKDKLTGRAYLKYNYSQPDWLGIKK
jgi:hypothetical protein